MFKILAVLLMLTSLQAFSYSADPAEAFQELRSFMGKRNIEVTTGGSTKYETIPRKNLVLQLCVASLEADGYRLPPMRFHLTDTQTGAFVYQRGNQIIVYSMDFDLEDLIKECVEMIKIEIL